MHYFNIHPQFIPSESVFSDERRRMFKGRAPVLPDGYMIVNGHISPSSYCDIGTGMRMFRDAHHYFSMVGKSVESYSELATELDDGEFLTDTELFSQVSRIIRAKYFVGSLRELSKAQKVEMARILHRDYRSSNDQLRRVLNMSQYEVDSLFPR